MQSVRGKIVFGSLGFTEAANTERLSEPSLEPPVEFSSKERANLLR